ncbi:MAG: hypothetical protein IJ439_07580 [Tyzzerella sp.]|nr:hypothetical protein [Tyzzerella sp.]
MKKKINKHHIFILTVVLALSVVGIIAWVMLQKSNVFHFGYEVETPVHDSDIAIDENTAIDGKRDEKFWNDNTLVFTETKSGIEVTTWAHLGENGLYLFTETDDTSVYWSKEKQFFENDSVEYYIDPRPEYSMQLDALKSDVKVRTDNIQVRVDTEGRSSTWFGRKTESGYPWVAGDFDVLTASVIDGKSNKKDGAKGYGVETFIPWEAMGLETTPEEIGVMPAFNNVDNREDTARTWFTVKGMNHAAPTSYARVDKDGFVQIGAGLTPQKELTANWKDKAYGSETIALTEVSETNQNPETRGELKAFLGEDGVYFIAAVHDKVLSSGSDSIWSNDGIEIVIDTAVKGDDSCFRDGVFRLAVDIDEGIETDICMDGYGDYVSTRRAVFCKTAISDYTGKSSYGYKNTLVYEVMVPYSSMGLTEKPSKLSFAWAVKSPNETTYIQNRRNGEGKMEGQDWLWSNRHYPLNPGEYYLLTSKGLEGDYTFPTWIAWDKCKVRSQAPTRYDYRGYAADDGLYINMVQYVDKIKFGGVSGTWKNITHIEMELWNGDVGYGWDGTYLAFFPDGSHYINSQVNVTGLEYKCTITDRGEGYKDGFRYELSYEIYLGFENNKENPEDGPYAYVQMMSCTPGESKVGYENSIRVTKDGDRKLWADNCKSYEFREEGIVAMDKEKDPYKFPAWTAWNNCKVRSDAKTRYDYRGRAADEGLYLNMVQYVDNIAHGGTNGTWKDITHIEMELWNGDVGYGWDGTYLAFFPDGSYYINNETNVTALGYNCTITDRGADYTKGYRYKLSYEIYIGFANNVDSEDGPYAYVQMMSCTPGETSEGYENSIQVVKDGDRKLWADDCKSYEFRAAGIVAKDTGEDNKEPEGPAYEFPTWTAWEDLAVRSDVPGRYDYRGFAADDGLYLNVVQYVDNVKQGGVADSWKDITHIEMELWNGDVGYGWDGTYLAFFPDGSHYINSDLNVTALEYKCTVTDRGANYADGYRYELSYEIYLGFENNKAYPEDGPYAFIQFMSHTPGETEDGYEKAETITKDGDRKLWTEESKSVEFRESGAVGKDSVYDTSAYEAKIAQYKQDWKEKGNDGKTTVFIGDSFFDGEFWSTFYDLYWNKDVLRCGVSSSTSYDWEVFTTEFLQYTKPKNIVMHIGTNNIYDDKKDADVTVQALQRLFAYMHETLPETKIYYFGITQRTYDDAKIAIVNEVNAAMQQWCSEKDYITFIGGTVERLTSDMLRDNVHPREDDECNAYEIFVEELAKTDIEIQSKYPEWEECTIRSQAPTRYDYRGYAADDGLYINMVQYVNQIVSGGTGGVWNDITHIEMELWNEFAGYGWGGTYLAFFPDGSYYDNSKDTNQPLNVKYICTITDRGEGYTEGYRYMLSYEIYLGFENNVGSDDGPYAFVQMMSHTPGESDAGYENVITINKDGSGNLWTDICDSYEFGENGIVSRRIDNATSVGSVPEDFPTVADFSTINRDLQSVDPNLYNFQMWTKDDGFYAYFIQKVPSVTLDNENNWLNTHVEMKLSNHCVGYGMDGTYIGLFPDGTYYINSDDNRITSKSLKVNVNSLKSGTKVIEYYFYLGFDNNLENPADGPYAYVKQYQCLPGVDVSNLDSITSITAQGGSDERYLTTGDEVSFQVHSAIDAKMYN